MNWLVSERKRGFGFSPSCKGFKDKLYLGHSVDLVDGGDIILEDGVWAEVIKEEIPTQKEIDRVLDYLKNKNNS